MVSSASTDFADNRLTLLDGRAIGWAEFGDPAGQPVFYLHGWPGSRFQGQRLDVAGWLVGCRIIAPERPGYGLSSAQPGRTLLDWPADLLELADSLGIERFAVVGASGGGPYALACAQALPERLTTLAVVSGLGPFDTPGLAQAAPRGYRALVSALAHAGRPLALGLDRVTRRVLSDPDAFLDWAYRQLPECDRRIVLDPEVRAIATRDIAAALADGGRAAARDAGLLAGPWGFALEAVTTEVHLWYGGMDTLAPPIFGLHLARTLPRARTRYLPNEGHYLVIPRAAEILEALVAP